MPELAKTEKKPKTVYTGKVHIAGGRENGFARSSDGSLDITLSPPGSGRPGTNPEQLLAAGWSACFEGAIGIAARRRQIKLPFDPAIDAEIDLNHGTEGYSLAARLSVRLPGLDRDTAVELIEEAHRTCPYSKALRGNIDIAINVA